MDKESIREDFLLRLKLGEKLDCPCCGRYAQIYKRKINRSMALDMINAFRLGAYHADGRYIHASKINRNHSGGGDFAKLRWWGLVEQQPNMKDSQKDSGWWRLTEDAILFMQGRIILPEYCLVYDNTVLGKSEKLVTFAHCLKQPFDYEELMKGMDYAETAL